MRRQWRRVCTPKGAFLSLMGLALFGFWIAGLVLRVGWGDSLAVDQSHLRERNGLWAMGLTVVTFAGAFSHRGLFLPKDEIERLFSAPISRRDLIRYRLKSNAMRSLFGGLFIGLMIARSAAHPGLAFLGVLLAMQTLAISQQGLAILLGALEAPLAKLLRRLWGIGLPLLILLFVGFYWMDGEDLGRLGQWPPLVALGEWFWQSGDEPLAHPLVGWMTWPFLPWSSMLSALSVGEFWLRFVICLGLHALLFEGIVRLPVDFRELSLDTAASVAARIKRTRRGGGAAAGRVSKRLLAARVPWLFGRGPTGAIAWRKSGAILRKARGTLTVSSLVLGFITIVALALGDTQLPAYLMPVGIAGVGTLYLCAGLRFDFRDELDRMDVIRAWPIAPRRLFVAMLLPEAALVSFLLLLCLVVHGVWRGNLGALDLGIMLVVPPVVFDWIALDNAVFLFAPVRFVAGQEGMLQNAGRGILMLLLRGSLGLLVGGLGGLAFFGARWIAERAGASELWRLGAGMGALWLVLLGSSFALTRLGGFVLARFDVSRDRA